MNNCVTLYQHEVITGKREYDEQAAAEGKENQWKIVPLKKTAWFKELDENEEEQHVLHFEILEFFSVDEETAKKVDKDPAAKSEYYKKLYRLTRSYIDHMLVVTDEFSAKEKAIMMNNSKAIMAFMFWVVKEKIGPFFRELMTDSSV